MSELHTEEQIREKKDCVRRGVVRLIEDYRNGLLENDEMLYHYIESLYELVQDARRG